MEKSQSYTEILLDKAIEKVEKLERALADAQETGCGGREYYLQGEARAEVAQELLQAEKLVEVLDNLLDEERREHKHMCLQQIKDAGCTYKLKEAERNQLEREVSQLEKEISMAENEVRA